MPDREDSRDVVGDAVDTVTLNQEVEWERCARLASPTERRALDALRSLAHFFAGSHAPGHSPAGTSATFAGSFAGGFMRNAARAILAIATVEVAAALLLLPWRWDAYRREHGELAVYMVTLFLGHGASACLLLLAGRRDPRASLLGAYFLLKATLPPMHMLPAFWGGCRGRTCCRIRSGNCRRRARSSSICTRTRSRLRRRSCGRSPANARGSIAGPVSTTSRGAWCRSA